MGIFDIDSGADNHLLNEQFHVFSKSPASVATALGDASNRSGHTVTASDVWGQEIPAFFYAKTQSVADSYKPLAKTNDLCRIGNSVAIFENGNWVVKYNSYTDIPDGHKFKNANGDEVIRFHKNRLAYNLNLDNNAADDGLNTTAKIQGWDEVNGKVYDYVATAPKFVSQFVTSTDKIVDGIPSKGFGPFVMAGTTTGDITKVLPEGTSDKNHYIANSFAGIIQFNQARTDAIYVHAFEYCGKTLKSAYNDIVELDEKISKISVTAAGGVQAVSDAAKAAGLEIDSVVVEGVTTPTLDLTTATITDGIFASTTGNKAKLVTAADVESYVAANAKVSVNGQEATTITIAGTAQGSSDLVKVVVTEDEDTPDNEIGLTLTATVDVATVTDGVIADGDDTKLVKAGDTKAIAEKAIETSLGGTTDGTIGKAISDVEGLISGVSQTVAGIEASLATGGTIAQAIADAQGDATQALSDAADALAEAQSKVASVTVGTVPTGVSFTTGTTPQLNIETVGTPAPGRGEYLVTAAEAQSIASGYATSAADTVISTIDGRSLASATTSTQGSYVSVTTSGTVGSGLTVNVDDSALASTVSAASTAIQTVKVNGTALTASNNAVDIILPKVKISGEEFPQHSHGFTVTTETYSGASSNHYIRIAAAQYTPASGETAGSWVQGTTDYFTTASTVKTAITDAISGIDFPDIKVYGGSNNYGISFTTETGEGAGSSHYMHIATAEYTASTDSWTNKSYLVTGATVESFVNDVVSEVSSDLTALENKVNAYHEAGVSYKVHTGTELPDLTIAENIETYKNVILLVPTTQHPDASPDLDDTEAMSGGYIEYLCVKTGETTYAWEKIGTTEADLEGYVCAISGNNQKGNWIKSSPVYAEISATGYLILGIDSATSDTLGVSKLFSGNYWELPSTVGGTAVSTVTASQMLNGIEEKLALKAGVDDVVNSINGAKGDVKLCVHNYVDYGRINPDGTSENGLAHANLWGMGVVRDANTRQLAIIDTFVGASKSYLTTANLPSDAVSVENNFVYNSSGEVITTIRPERMVSGFDASRRYSLKSFVGDLSNLTTTPLGDGQKISTFYFCSALTTFIGDLSSLTNGSRMFESCSSLTTFVSDLSSLTEGANMFWNTNLSVESVETIADSINEYEGEITITWNSTPSEDKRQALVDALSLIVDKGWRVSTNSELIPLFDSEKYQTGYQTVQPLDLNSEPQTIYYVVKK